MSNCNAKGVGKLNTRGSFSIYLLIDSSHLVEMEWRRILYSLNQPLLTDWRNMKRLKVGNKEMLRRRRKRRRRRRFLLLAGDDSLIAVKVSRPDTCLQAKSVILFIMCWQEAVIGESIPANLNNSLCSNRLQM